MKLIVPVAAAILLAGCSAKPQQTLTKTELQVVMPDRAMFYCQNVRKFPNPETLTDVQVAKLIVELHKKNTECQKNINAVYKFLEEAKKQTQVEKKDAKK